MNLPKLPKLPKLSEEIFKAKPTISPLAGKILDIPRPEETMARTTPAQTTFKPMEFRVGEGMTPYGEAMAYEKIRGMQAPGEFVKVPFAQKEFVLPKGEFLTGVIKRFTELPEKVLTSLKEIPHVIAHKDVPEYKKIYRVPSYAEDARNFTEGLIHLGYSTKESALIATLQAGGQAILDVSILSSLITSGANATMNNIVPKATEKIAAWKTLGQPKTAEGVTRSYRQLVKQFHPDRAGELSTPVMAEINKAVVILRKGGIPTQADFIIAGSGKGLSLMAQPSTAVFQKVGGKIRLTPLQDIIKFPSAAKTPISTLPLKQLPGQAPVPGQPPAIGLSLKKVEKVGGAIPKELEPLAKEARKYKSAEEFVKGVDLTIKEKPQYLYRGIGGQAPQAQMLVQGIHAAETPVVAKEFASWTRGLPNISVLRLSPRAKIADLDKVKMFLAEKKQLADMGAITNALKLKGYDGAVGTLPGYGKEYIIINQRMLKDMSVLREDVQNFYTQATKGIKEVKPEVKPKTAPTIRTEVKPTDIITRHFKEPTLMKYITPSNRYARSLGVYDLIEPSIKAKTAMEIERANVFKQIDAWEKTWRKLKGVSPIERAKEVVKVIPPKAHQSLFDLLDKHETSISAGLKGKEAEVFDQMRDLTKGMLERTNEVRTLVGLQPIGNIKSYITHIRDMVGKKEIAAKYPFPEEISYWLTRIHPKHIFNPTAFKRIVEDPKSLMKDPFRALKAMTSMDLKQVYLEQPNLLFTEQLKELKGEIPAITRQWTEAYINEVIKGYPTALDKLTNRSLEAMGVRWAMDTMLRPFGRTTGFNMAKRFAGQLSRLTHDAVIWGRVKLVVRNHTQKFLSLGLYDTKAFIKAVAPMDKELQAIIKGSDFWKSSNREFMESSVGLTKGIISKLEKIGFKPYSRSHISNVTHTMKTAYHAGMELVKNPKYAKLGWTKEDVLREMEGGAQTAQYWYNAMGMPELYRSGLGKMLGNLQSWAQNYTTNYWREMLLRAFTGKTSWGKEIPLKWRLGAIRHIVTSLILTEGLRKAFGLDYRQVALLGVLPSYLSPQGQMVVGLMKVMFAKNDAQRKAGIRQLKYSVGAFIPGSMAWKDFAKVWRGDDELKSLFFHTERKQKEPKEKIRQGIPGLPALPKLPKLPQMPQMPSLK
jgi:hypothetical protein